MVPFSFLWCLWWGQSNLTAGSSLNSGVNRGVPVRISYAQTIGQVRLAGCALSSSELMVCPFC